MKLRIGVEFNFLKFACRLYVDMGMSILLCHRPQSILLHHIRIFSFRDGCDSQKSTTKSIQRNDPSREGGIYRSTTCSQTTYQKISKPRRLSQRRIQKVPRRPKKWYFLRLISRICPTSPRVILILRPERSIPAASQSSIPSTSIFHLLIIF